MTEALERPDTFDPWAFILFCLENGSEFYVRVMRPDPNREGQEVLTLVPLPDLTPSEWIYWVKRWYMVSSTQVLTMDQWIQLLSESA